MSDEESTIEEEGESLRAALEAALGPSDDAEGTEGGHTESADASPGDAGGSADDDGAAEPAVSESAEPGLGDASGEPAGGEVARGDAEPASKPEGEAPPAANLKAPQTWRPAVREEWAKLPEAVQREVLKREHDMARGMQDASTSRKLADEFEKTVAPYLSTIQAENSTPMQAVASLMNTAYRLRSDPPQQKAELVAGLIQQYGVDIRALDSVLSQRVHGGAQGSAPSPGIDSATQQWVQQQLAPVVGAMQEFRQGQESARVATQAEVRSELEQFAADPKNEFFADVRGEMADLMELASKRGEQLSLQDAYSRAIMSRSDIAEVVTKRQLEEAARKASADASAARAAAVSVRGTPPETGGSRVNANGSLRDLLEATWNEASSGL